MQKFTLKTKVEETARERGLWVDFVAEREALKRQGEDARIAWILIAWKFFPEMEGVQQEYDRCMAKKEEIESGGGDPGPWRESEEHRRERHLRRPPRPKEKPDKKPPSVKKPKPKRVEKEKVHVEQEKAPPPPAKVQAKPEEPPSKPEKVHVVPERVRVVPEKPPPEAEEASLPPSKEEPPSPPSKKPISFPSSPAKKKPEDIPYLDNAITRKISEPAQSEIEALIERGDGGGVPATEAIVWAMERADLERVDPGTAPSPLAYSLWRRCRGSETFKMDIFKIWVAKKTAQIKEDEGGAKEAARKEVKVLKELGEGFLAALAAEVKSGV